MKNIKYLVLFLSTLFISCTKSAGTGGRATIKGNIVVDNINIQGNIVDSYDAQDHEVYIIYGQQNNTMMTILIQVMMDHLSSSTLIKVIMKYLSIVIV